MYIKSKSPILSKIKESKFGISKYAIFIVILHTSTFFQ